MSTTYSAAVLLLLVAAFAPAPTAAANSRHASTTAVGRYSWTRNLKLLGAASFVPGETAVSLTTNSSDGIRAGRALSTEPVRLLLARADPRAAPAPASFLSKFRFHIIPSPSYGDGLAFLLTSSPTFLGASNGFLGLYSKSAGELADVSTVAVELDTHRDVALGDKDDNHVALDVGSIISMASASPVVDLKAGVPITAWVEYRSERRRLRAWFSYSSRRPTDPALSVNIDLSQVLHEDVYVGFSASNGEGTALHIIESWSFRTFRNSQGSASPAPSSAPVPTTKPKNSTDNSSQGSTTPAPLPVSSSQAKNSPMPPVPEDGQNGLLIVFGIVCILISVAAVLVLGIVCVWSRRQKTKKFVQLSMLSEKNNMLPKSALRSC